MGTWQRACCRALCWPARQWELTVSVHDCMQSSLIQVGVYVSDRTTDVTPPFTSQMQTAEQSSGCTVPRCSVLARRGTSAADCAGKDNSCPQQRHDMAPDEAMPGRAYIRSREFRPNKGYSSPKTAAFAQKEGYLLRQKFNETGSSSSLKPNRKTAKT